MTPFHLQQMHLHCNRRGITPHQSVLCPRQVIMSKRQHWLTPEELMCSYLKTDKSRVLPDYLIFDSVCLSWTLDSLPAPCRICLLVCLIPWFLTLPELLSKRTLPANLLSLLSCFWVRICTVESLSISHSVLQMLRVTTDSIQEIASYCTR